MLLCLMHLGKHIPTPTEIEAKNQGEAVLIIQLFFLKKSKMIHNSNSHVLMNKD